MIWIFQKENIGSDREKLIQACKDLNVDWMEIQYYDPNFYAKLPEPEDELAIAYGSINFIKTMRNSRLYPGFYCNWDAFKCSTYYAYLGKYLLNQNYCFTTWAEFNRNKESYFERYHNNSCLFIRPNGGDKKFTGQVIDRSTNLDKITIEDIGPTTLMVVAEPQNIIAEWRYVVVDRQLITCSRYKKDGRLDVSNLGNAEATGLACQIVRETWTPDPAFCIDICETNNGFYLLELNSLSCSGFYDCDHYSIVKSVTNYILENEYVPN